MSDQSSNFTGVALDPGDENSLLRAALAEAQARIRSLEQAAESDPLTGLPNERRFRTELERVCNTSARHGTPAALVSVSLTALAGILARHGELARHTALVHVANVLSGLIRTTDFLARTGASDFALILDHLDQNSAIETAERLGRCLGAYPVEISGNSVCVGAAIAVTGILAGDTPEGVLSRAARNVERAREDA